MTSVLVVDDDPVARAVVKVMLGRLGYDVIEAADLAGATSILAEPPGPQRLRVDVVVSDYVLPDGRGLDLLDRFSEVHGRFVLITGTQERQELGDDRVSLVSGYLTKPVGSNDLADILDAVLFDASAPLESSTSGSLGEAA